MADPSQPLFLHSDFTKAPAEIVIDLINFDNGTDLQPNELTFGLPQPITGSHNTALEVTGVPGVSRYEGSADITYNRVDLATVPGVRETGFGIFLDDATSISDIVVEISERYQINLTPDDYIDGPLPDVSNTDTLVNVPFQLVANPKSLIFIGEATLHVFRKNVLLRDVIRVTALNGLVYRQPVV